MTVRYMTYGLTSPTSKAIADSIALVLCVFLLGACNDTLSHFSSYHQDMNFKGMNYAAADRLVQRAGDRLGYQTPIYGKALRPSGIHNSGQERTPAFAGVVIEHVARRLKRHGYDIQPAAEPGEEIEKGLVLTGIYTPKPDNIDIELVLKSAADEREISHFGYRTERTYKIDKLMRKGPVRNEVKELMNQVTGSF